jgi:septal ring factor EnvC (AmiA/AmiB activator)
MGMKHSRTFFYVYYPSYYYSSSTDQAIAPLSYIKATTPEYIALQSEYQALQQQVSQGQTQNQQLQTTISQQSATINQLNQQLASAGTMTQRYQTLALVFGILAAALAALAVYQSRKGKKTETTKTK